MRTVREGRAAGARRAPGGMAILASTLTLLLVACAQAPRAAAPPGGQAPALLPTPGLPATTPVSTHLDNVSVDLTVRSRHHKPVLDLAPSQITVSDDGSPVQLSSLRQVVPASGAQHLIAFVFDRLDTGAAKAARRTAEKILGVIPDEGYSLAVLQVNGRLRILQGYTRDFRLTDAALVNATPGSPAPPSASITPAEQALITSTRSNAGNISSVGREEGKTLLSALEQSQRIVEERHGSPSLAALQALVLSDRLLTGRKFIFYFSHGIGANSDTREMLQSVVSLANRAGVTIYVVDASPLTASMTSAMQASQVSSILGSGSTNGSISAFGTSKGSTSGAPAAIQAVLAHDVAGFEFGDIPVDENPIAALAGGTGGMYLSASGGSKTQLQQLHEDLTTWYQASWAAPMKTYDGQFRPVNIRSLRKGVVIRARSGYFALPPAGAAEILPFEMPLLNILAGAAFPSDVPMHAGILDLGALPEGNASELIVQVPVSGLESHEDGNTHIASVHAAILAVIKDSKGAVLQRFGGDFPLHETPDMFRRDSGQTLTLERTFSADPGAYTLETAVLDRVANKAGAQRITFTIEPPPQGPALSDVALVQSIEPLPEDSQNSEPMRYLDGRIVPNLGTDLAANTSSLSVFFLLHPVAGSQNQPRLRLQIFRDSRLLTDMPMELHTVSGTGGAVPYLATLRGHHFPTGTYQVKALLSQDGSTIASSASFRVTGPAGASDSSQSSASDVASPAPDPTDPGVALHASDVNNGFVITASTKPIPPPKDAEIQAMIKDTRQRALAWSDTLRNFLCLEVTNQYVAAAGEDDWRHKDTLVERMRYVDHEQTRTTLLLNGEPSSVQPDRLDFAHSNGEFGAMFHVVFEPSARATFTWKRSSFLDGLPVQVFAFQVARANSSFNLSDRENHTRLVGFHGLLYLDPATRSVRRLSIVADDIPPELLIRASSVSVDYSWISMQNHDFLLPVHGVVSLQESQRHPVRNEFEFRDYHRFGSKVRILAAGDLNALSKH